MGRGVWRALRLARGLLLPAVAMCALYAAGCIIPTPLEQAPQETNEPPSFPVGQENPTFGPITSTSSDTIAFEVTAADPNLDDTLTMRLFKLGSSGRDSRVYLGIEAPLVFPSPPDPDHPTWRSGSLPQLNYCQILGNVSNIPLYVRVADR